MQFEEILESLNKRAILLTSLGQIEDGAKWSVSLRRKGDFTHGYGQGKTIEAATKQALAVLKSHMTDKQWKELAKSQPPPPKKKKRIRMKGRG